MSEGQSPGGATEQMARVARLVLSPLRGFCAHDEYPTLTRGATFCRPSGAENRTLGETAWVRSLYSNNLGCFGSSTFDSICPSASRVTIRSPGFTSCGLRTIAPSFFRVVML